MGGLTTQMTIRMGYPVFGQTHILGALIRNLDRTNRMGRVQPQKIRNVGIHPDFTNTTWGLSSTHMI